MIYASKELENSGASPTADRILFLIKSKGPTSAARLAQALDLTPEAARQQVQKLVAGGLLEGQLEAAAGVGRPRQNWALTEAGNRRFPDTHAQLTVQLIGTVRQLFGEQGLDRLISQREADARTLYQQRCNGKTVAQRLAQLAAVRSEEGYMARVERDGKDWLLIEDHCPICAAARSCQGFCRSELSLFQDIVGGDSRVTREQHVLAGASRCVYRIELSRGR
ncbi:helix-turn-helix domain-containing protein [Hydrogenophaga sp. 2FB]|uniref:helix-turn-helix transcriptional regulator n=1 Tax=Hydrogenophaga sp. 2FB TaxID=2502187 RepID=UPI0010FA40F5|nr:helix-turn-helix domain-containing protein [Hydrogenophaga sp. 2FB]